MNKPMTTAMFCMALLLGGLSSCTTNDVEDIQGGGEQDLYEIKDRALGEYLFITVAVQTKTSFLMKWLLRKMANST